MAFTKYFSTLNALYEELKNDENYRTRLDLEEAFVFLGLREVHRSVREDLDEEKSKSIVYEHDILTIIRKWEKQTECAMNEFTFPPMYSDLVLVPIIDELMEIFKKEYEIFCIKQDRDGRYEFSHKYETPLFSWSSIYWIEWFKKN